MSVIRLWRHRKRLILLGILVVIITVLQNILPRYPYIVDVYGRYIFKPFQLARNILFGYIPVSIGDILYVLGGMAILIGLGRWIYFLVKYRTHKKFLWNSLFNTVVIIATAYILFFVGWGGNYYKPALSDYWQLDDREWSSETTLPAYDLYLVSELNTYAPQYVPLKFNEADKRARRYYRLYTDNRTSRLGLNAKPSVFGYMMQYMGIQGYYNPFTGEAQVNRRLPSFMLPYVICHELAHQSGIAAEDDANLLAYVLSMKTADSSFRYSACLNLWLYTHARLRLLDTSLAANYRSQLNPLTLRHLDTLRQIRDKYRSDVSLYSGHLYDQYLRLHNQEDGLESYSKVAVSAWAWNLQAKNEDTIRLP